MRLGFAGTPAVAASILSSLSNSEIKFEVVITKPDTTGRRGNQIIASEVSQIANKLGIPLLKPHRLDESFAGQLAAFSLDAIIVVAYGKLIPTSLLEIPRSGWFNLHFSLLPKFRGASPVQTALLKGEVKTGVSLFKIDSGLDTGPLLSQAAVEILDEDDAKSLFGKLEETGTQLIIESLDLLKEPSPHLMPQTEQSASIAAKLAKEIFRIDWRNSNRDIANQVRALTVDGCAYTLIDGSRVKICKVRLIEEISLLPGKIDRSNGKIIVGTGSGSIELLVVQPEGKQQMPASSWYNGVRQSEPEFD